MLRRWIWLRTNFLLPAVTAAFLIGPDLFAQRYIDLNQVEGDVHIQGADYQDFLGTDLASGDVNGDGIEDLLVATWKWIPNGPSTHYVFYGQKHPEPNKVIDLKIDPPDLVILTPKSTDPYGSSIAAGDVNGDGIEDIIIGEPHFQTYDEGYVCVVLGDPAYPPGHVIDLEVEDPYIAIYGYQHSGRAGWSVAGGDVNHDGCDDILIGATSTNAWGSGGSVFVVFGSPSFPPGYQVNLQNGYDLVLSGGYGGMDLGWHVCSGDVNRDGIDDLVASAPANGSVGSVYVVYGSSNLKSGLRIDVDDSDLTVHGENGGEAMGKGLACGDVNGDGFDDLVMGAPYYAQNGWGRVSVVYGGIYPPNHVISLSYMPEDITILPVASGDNKDGQFGNDTACGDLNGDGIEDMLILSPYSYVNGNVDTGRVYALYGRPDFPPQHVINLSDESPAWKVDGKIGYPPLLIFSHGSVAAPDFNGDGMAEMCAGAPSEQVPSGEYAGAVHVFYGLGKVSYGDGKPGSGGITPTLASLNPEEPILGTSLSIDIHDGLGGAPGLFFMALEKGFFPFPGGTFLLDPACLALTFPFNLSNPGGGPGAGSFQFIGSIPLDPVLVVYPIYMQALVSDPGASKGVSMTNGLQVTFGSVGE